MRDIASPIVRALDLELIDVECTGQGPRTLVRVFIDKPEGVTLEDCQQVHVSLGHALDVQDPIPHAYTLEVSSPGLDRPLKRREDYLRATGKLVNVKLRQPLKGKWRVVGRLQDVDEAGITVDLSDGNNQESRRSIPWDDIAQSRLEVEF